MDFEKKTFDLQINESYDKICGEILLTTFKRIAFKCTQCDFDLKYGAIEEYLSHLYDYHVNNALKNLESIDEVSMSTECSQDTISQEEQWEIYTEPYIKIEIEALHNEGPLNEEEFPIATLHKVLDDNEENGESEAITNQKMTKIAQGEYVRDVLDELQIPKDIREVKKRTLRGPFVTPAEERKHKCPICGLGFKERHNMRHHFRRHSNQKDHQCPQCDKRFFTPTEVRIHMQFHTRERPFLCSDCGRAFLTKSHFVNHAKRHANQRDFKCSVCNKAFYNSGQLKSHMQGHSSERPFGCRLCKAAFSRKEALRNHMKLHENKREYKCKFCDAEFNQKAGLFSHMKTNHKLR